MKEENRYTVEAAGKRWKIVYKDPEEPAEDVINMQFNDHGNAELIAEALHLAFVMGVGVGMYEQ